MKTHARRFAARLLLAGVFAAAGAGMTRAALHPANDLGLELSNILLDPPQPTQGEKPAATDATNPLAALMDRALLEKFAGMPVIILDAESFMPHDGRTVSAMSAAELEPFAADLKTRIAQESPQLAGFVEQGVKDGTLPSDSYVRMLRTLVDSQGGSFIFGHTRTWFMIADLPIAVQEEPDANSMLDLVMGAHLGNASYRSVPVFGNEIFKPRAVIDALEAARTKAGLTQAQTDTYVANMLVNNPSFGPAVFVAWYAHAAGLADPSARPDVLAALEKRMQGVMDRISRIDRNDHGGLTRAVIRIASGADGIEKVFARAWLSTLGDEFFKGTGYDRTAPMRAFVNARDVQSRPASGPRLAPGR